jgi:hypothetical protein
MSAFVSHGGAHFAFAAERLRPPRKTRETPGMRRGL